MDIQQLDIPFRSIFIVIIICVIKINILNVSRQLFLFGGFSIKLMATESLELFSYLCEYSFILDGETC